MSPNSRGVVRPARCLSPRWRRLSPAPAVFLALLAGAAWGGNAPKLAVLEFRVAPAGAPGDFGVTAARLLASALGATGKYDLAPQDQVEAALRKHNLRPPFGVGHLQLLSDVLGAELLLHGSVRALTLDAAAGSASVTLAFEVVDGRSGELRTSGEARGAQSATATVTANQQEVIVRALAAAAENLAETLTGARVAATPPPAAPGTAGNAAAPPVAASALPAALVPAAGAAADEPRLSPPRTELTVAAAPKTAAGSAAPAPNVRIEIIAKPTAPGTAAPPVIPPAHSEAAGDLALPVEAKVLAKLAPDRVLITLGRTMIVTPKMELDVFRVTYPRGEGSPSRSKIGRLRVLKVNATDAEARVLDGAAIIRTGDLACGPAE